MWLRKNLRGLLSVQLFGARVGQTIGLSLIIMGVYGDIGAPDSQTVKGGQSIGLLLLQRLRPIAGCSRLTCRVHAMCARAHVRVH